MQKLNFIWKEKKAQYQTGESLYLNRICIAGYSWNAGRSKGDTSSNNWAGNIDLPNLRDSSRRLLAETEETMRIKIEQVVNSWFTEALKENNDAKS
jgi:hypothetical protein